jgi:hypothetical protein
MNYLFQKIINYQVSKHYVKIVMRKKQVGGRKELNEDIIIHHVILNEVANQWI